MDPTLVVKCLVRATTLADGKRAFILCGVAIPDREMPTDPRDELWVARLAIVEVHKYVNVHNISFSPEDFLEGKDDCMDPKRWAPKEPRAE